jgi:hypothetical protein
MYSMRIHQSFIIHLSPPLVEMGEFELKLVKQIFSFSSPVVGDLLTFSVETTRMWTDMVNIMETGKINENAPMYGSNGWKKRKFC